MTRVVGIAIRAGGLANDLTNLGAPFYRPLLAVGRGRYSIPGDLTFDVVTTSGTPIFLR